MASEGRDFHEVPKFDEDLDFSRLVECPHCKKPIPIDAVLCLYCAETVYQRKRRPWVTVLTLVIILIFLAFILKR